MKPYYYPALTLKIFIYIIQIIKSILYSENIVLKITLLFSGYPLKNSIVTHMVLIAGNVFPVT